MGFRVSYIRSLQLMVMDSGKGDPAHNMAFDEALLEAMPRLGKPLLRFYGWTEGAASFGYFQKYSEIERLTPLRPLVRRPTGGGLVSHEADWTYSIAIPTSHEWYSVTATESYIRVHEAIQAAFAKLNVATELASCCRKSEPGQCFFGHEKFDLLWNGRKIAGAAQRRTRAGLLIQGSVQPPPLSLDRQQWQQWMCKVGSESSDLWQSFEPDEQLLSRARQLLQQKYSQASYNQKR
jgi:lipoate-protein ligase A